MQCVSAGFAGRLYERQRGKGKREKGKGNELDPSQEKENPYHFLPPLVGGLLTQHSSSFPLALSLFPSW